MKAVILARAGSITIVDLMHDIAPFSITEGGFWLAQSYAYFPEGTVHIAVIDPGVGSQRRLLGACSNGHYFLAPDNGLLDQVVIETERVAYRFLDISYLSNLLQFGLVSNTFHGRDIFAPIAAALVTGQCQFDNLGPVTSDIVRTDIKAPQKSAQYIAGTIITIDHYGNLISNISPSDSEYTQTAWVDCKGQRISLRKTYSDGANGEIIALINSFSVLEIAQTQGNAAKTLGIDRGEPIRLMLE